ncbi:SH3 domain-containing protein [uncultured Ruminococcus sp.]|uniref:SH3 domain-containing protein n=1 Tax=uncultured Ruminococcus sp. TaxID=165186 RepID=UPI0025CE02BB|nr:SH3 domain-containing protein [uncultured Ruminococcus sp.]
MNNMEDQTPRKRPRIDLSGAAAIIVVGIFVVCIIFLFATKLFSANSAKAPAGLDTATINTDITQPKADDSQTPAVTTVPDSGTDSISDSSSKTDTTTSEADEALGTMYITEYAYLHTAPSNDAENIVCMSPGIEVTVLNYEDNGYVKITFQNIDGPLTGYIYKDYLSETQTVVPAWQQ